jgi:hypothetical protein
VKGRLVTCPVRYRRWGVALSWTHSPKRLVTTSGASWPTTLVRSSGEKKHVLRHILEHSTRRSEKSEREDPVNSERSILALYIHLLSPPVALAFTCKLKCFVFGISQPRIEWTLFLGLVLAPKRQPLAKWYANPASPIMPHATAEGPTRSAVSEMSGTSSHTYIDLLECNG